MWPGGRGPRYHLLFDVFSLLLPKQTIDRPRAYVKGRVLGVVQVSSRPDTQQRASFCNEACVALVERPVECHFLTVARSFATITVSRLYVKADVKADVEPIADVKKIQMKTMAGGLRVGGFTCLVRFRFRLNFLNIRNWLNIHLNIRLNVQSAVSVM